MGSFYSYKKYHCALEFAQGTIFEYAKDFNIKQNDTFTMILDMTQQNHQNGVLSYIINAEVKKKSIVWDSKQTQSDQNEEKIAETNEHSNIAFDDIDINQTYRLAVGLFWPGSDLVALLP